MIRVIDLHIAFGQNKVLRGINLTLKKGETLVVIGQSGSGKSVLIRHLIGLIKPDKGEIYIDGVEITRLKDDELHKITRRFGLLFQGTALFDSMTVAQNVSFGLERYTDLSREEIQERVNENLALVGLRGIENLMPHELSGGMKKRVGLARAIAYRPDIILYDEPSTGIDPIRADAINDLIIRMKHELNVSTVIITHDMTSAYKVADKIAMLYAGRIIEEGVPADIKKSQNPVVQQFIRGRAKGPIAKW
ncbi:MAG: ABC transporter ATP-binding protein [Candidatus Aminicenantes bacterium]|nr:ABC transporter ATP-binding protein [Candidatus Aminicenantes bacterium]MBL7082225.1 ABC transporter ATP-binding protein [Candidatus Aminicenantes bacterium]